MWPPYPVVMPIGVAIRHLHSLSLCAHVVCGTEPETASRAHREPPAPAPPETQSVIRQTPPTPDPP